MKDRLKTALRFIRRNRVMTRLLSFILTLVLVFYVIPSTIYVKAQELLQTDESDAAVSVDASESSASSSLPAERVGVLFEDESLREESTKHFHLEDGTYLAAQYNYPVHTLDANGEWQDIDNVLSESGKEFTNNSARIKFAKNINGSSELFTLHDGNAKITMTLIGANKGTSGEVTNNSDAESESKLQKMMNLEKLSSRIIYRDILDGVDLEYIAYSMNVKENIIVKERKDSYSYSFELKLNGLTPTLTERGDIELCSDDTDELTYVIPAPVVYDSVGEHAPGGISAYTLTHINGKKYILTVTVESEWMNKEERAFPVTIDPAVTAAGSSIIDVCITSASPTLQTNTVSDLTLLFGTTERLIHWKSTALPEVPSSAKIIDVSVNLKLRNGYNAYVGAYEVTTDWDETLTWEKYMAEDITARQGSTKVNLLDYHRLTLSQFYSWNVTEIAEKWYNGYNYGVAFVCLPLGANGAMFYSNEASSTGNRPSFTVTYKDMKGIESYWPFTSHNAGIAGNGSINLVTGKLVFTIPTLATTDNIFSYSPTLVYNSSMSNKLFNNSNANVANTTSFLSRGFKLSLTETLVKRGTEGTDEYYIYSDADGTEHIFLSTNSGNYRDEDGLGLTLSVETDGNITMENGVKVIKTFEKIEDTSSGDIGWRLSSITDINGNKLIFTFPSEFAKAFMPSKISLLPNGNSIKIDLLEFYYGSDSHLRMIYNPAAKLAVVLRYSSTYNGVISSTYHSYLRQVDYAYGNANVTTANWNSFMLNHTAQTNITVYDSATYSYDSAGKLTEAKNVKENTSVKYTYTTNTIRQVSEYSADQLGNSFYVSLFNKLSRVQGNGNDGRLGTLDDVCTNYVLDNYGRCISVYSTSDGGETLYGASMYSYDTQANSRNSIKQSFSTGESNVNYVVNGSFEDVESGVPRLWRTTGEVSSTQIDKVDGSFEKSVTITMSTTRTASIYQNISLPSGEYTCSMPISFSNCDEVSGQFEILDFETLETIYSETITPIPSSGEMFYSVSFEIPYIAVSRDVVLYITFSKPASVTSVPSIEIDSVSVTKSSGAAKFDLVEYGSFEDTVISSSDTFWISETGSAANIYESYGDHGKVLSLINTTGGTKYAKQNIYTVSAEKLSECDQGGAFATDNMPHTFSVTAFATSDNAVFGKPFRIRVEIVYYTGANSSDITTNYYYDFIAGNEEWQCISGIFTLGYDQSGEPVADYLCVKSITVYCDCSSHYNVNAAFNDVSITYAGVHASTKYKYNEDGRIESCIYGEKGQFYKYDTNGNVVKYADNDGVYAEYVYDTSGRVVTITKSTFTYEGSDDFPYHLDDPFSAITKVRSKRVEYTYNTFGLKTKEETYAYTESGNPDSSTKPTEVVYGYDTAYNSKIFGALTSERHLTSSSTKYYYNSDNGNLVASVNTGTKAGTAYSYDPAGRLIAVYPATYISDEETFSSISDAEEVEYVYDSKNRLSTISTESTTYTLLYDGFGNQSSISVGNNTLVSYEYGAYNGKLSQITYGNGQIVKYVYNDLEMLSEIWYNDDTEPTYEYRYTTDGRISVITNNLSGTVTAYKYDADGRPVSTVEYTAQDTDVNILANIRYNANSYVNEISYITPYTIGTDEKLTTSLYEYFYDDEGRISEENLLIGDRSGTIEYVYDGHGRLSSIDHSFSAIDGEETGFSYTTEYTYLTYLGYTYPLLWESTTTIQSGSATNSVYYGFTYDGEGKIVRQVKYYNDVLNGTWDYEYDDLSQLIREDNHPLSRTYVYEYDNAGNIISKYEYKLTYSDEITTELLNTDSYIYSTSAWGDLLTSYNGTAITYDAIGNPLNYYNGSSYTFTWNGRQLATAVKGSNTMSFTYNDEGLKTSKTVNGVTTYYLYSGTQLISEYNNTETIVYIYDVSGAPIGFKYRLSTYTENVWDAYWYEKDLLGNITAIYSSEGAKLLSYKYDAWGITTASYSNGGASTTAVNNRLTYRGYYYDSDLGMYYLQSRYYDPVICRFINADDVSYLGANEDLIGYNLYAYCSNNPVSNVDPEGNSIISIIKAIVVIVAIVTTVKAIEEGIENEEQIVLDLSSTVSGEKYGFSLLLDFEGSNIELYPHVGRYVGYSSGFAYSVGKVENYDGPNSYKGPFIFSGGGCFFGYDGCLNPFDPINGTSANSLTFSTSPSIYGGVDLYFPAISFNYEEWRFN